MNILYIYLLVKMIIKIVFSQSHAALHFVYITHEYMLRRGVCFSHDLPLSRRWTPAPAAAAQYSINMVILIDTITPHHKLLTTKPVV